MFRLTALIYCFTGPTLAGSLIVAALVAGQDTLAPILVAAAIGFVAGVPAAWMIAKYIRQSKT